MMKKMPQNDRILGKGHGGPSYKAMKEVTKVAETRKAILVRRIKSVEYQKPLWVRQT